jgi:hypothetical protein
MLPNLTVIVKSIPVNSSIGKPMTNDEMFKLIVLALQAHLGRLPTEDEVVNFIMDKDSRQSIWNGLALQARLGNGES